MKTRMTLAAIAALALAASGARAELPLPEGSDWVLRADLAQLKTTQLGTFMMSELGAEEVDRKFKALKAMFNFDPRTDLDSITLFGATSDERKGVILLEGRLDSQRAIDLIGANDTYEKADYHGIAVHHWVDSRAGGISKPNYGAFATPTQLVVSQDRGTLESTLDILGGRSAAVAVPLVDRLAPGWKDNTFLFAVANTANAAMLNPQAALLKQAEGAMLTFGEADGHFRAGLRLLAANATTAQQLQMIVQGLIGLLTLQEGQHPERAELARAMQVTTEGEAVDIALSFPAAEMIETLKQMAAQNAPGD